MSCDGQSWTKPQVIKDKGVKGAPALGVVGDWLCAMVVDDDANHLFCLRSKDGLSFEAQEISNSRKKLLDVGAASHGGWLYVACTRKKRRPAGTGHLHAAYAGWRHFLSVWHFPPRSWIADMV